MSIVFDDCQPYNALDQALAAEIDAALCRHYPGHPWSVRVDNRTGLAYVWHDALATNEGFVLHLKKLTGPGDIKRTAILVGGEFLERHGLPRGRARETELLEASQQAWRH